MEEREFKKLYDFAKADMIKQSHGVAAANKMVKVDAKRISLPLEGREVEIVYYEAKSSNAPLFVGYHGGGFLFGGCALDNNMWLAVRDALDVNIASVGYRMSPDYMWEETLADSYEALVYLYEHASEFNFNKEHISVMGQSAGGNLAAAVALKCNQEKSVKLDNQILIYPFLDVYTDPDEKGSGSFSGIGCYVMNDLHCNHEEAKNPFVSPVYASKEMLVGLPNAIMAFSEEDNLKFEGMRYATMLKEAGVKVSEKLFEGMPHAYFESGFKKPTKFEIQFLGEHAQEIIDNGSLFTSAKNTLDFIKENLVR